MRRPRRRWRHRRAGERERFDAVRSEVGPAGQCVSSVLLASVVSFAPISGFRSGRHLTGQAGASHETKVVAALWTTLSVIPSEVEGSAPGRFCAFQRRNADLERRSRGKGKIAWYLGSCPGSDSRSCWIPFFLTESTEDTENGFPGLCALCALCEKPKVQIPRLAALARDDGVVTLARDGSVVAARQCPSGVLSCEADDAPDEQRGVDRQRRPEQGRANATQ